MILIIFGVTIYFFESFHQTLDFQDRLKDRVTITENFFLEKESFSASEFEKIRTQFLHILPSETEEVIEVKKGDSPVFKHSYTANTKQKIVENDAHSFREGDLQGESKFFKVNGKEYLIIVTAIDEVGIQNLSFLISRIIILILVAIPIIFLISFSIAKRSLLPISKKIQHANQIGASNLNERLKVINSNDELGKMATAFNKLLDRIEVSFVAQKSFIANASHEIRNPLTAIMGEAEVAVSKTRTPEEYKESLSVILEESETLNATVTNLLQLSKVTANEEGVQYVEIELDSFLEEVKTSYDYTNPENQLLLKVPPGDYRIMGNKNLLKAVIINLWDNACKYSKNDLVEVSLDKNEEEILLRVSDKGVGIPASEISKIIAPFYRAANTFNFKGSGIGLALASKIIALHSGTIEIESEEGKGTNAIVKLPQA